MIELRTPYFAQAAVLEILPDLPAKTLQNWLSRNVLVLENQNPGRQAKRYFTPYGVIVLAFMIALTERGFSPSDSAEMSTSVADRASEIFDRLISEVDISSDGPFIPYPANSYDKCQRHLIMKSDGRFFLTELHDDIDVVSWKRTVFAPIYTVIETDMFIIDTVNKIISWTHRNAGKMKQLSSRSVEDASR